MAAGADLDRSASGAAAAAAHRRWVWDDPRSWGIPVRSALAAAAVVLFAFLAMAAVVLGVLHRQLLIDVDAAADRRVRDVVAGLQFDPPAELDTGLLATDAQIAVVQVIDSSGALVRASAGAQHDLLVDPALFGGAGTTVSTESEDGTDLRVSGATADRQGNRYTVLVGADGTGVDSTVTIVAVLLVIAMPLVVAGAAAATFVLVRRSLRSVEAIRLRVADISAHDLSERVPVPAHRDEVSALAVTMNDMLARIQSGHAAQRRFVGDASHELRSPLSTIISAVEVGLAHPELLGPELVGETVLPEAQRMQTLIDDLLLLARADEHGVPLRSGDVDLDDLADGEARRIERATAHTVQVDLAPARLTGDAEALTRVVRNLLENAVRHAHSRVEVSVGAADATVFLRVGDDGSGIPAEDRTRVFDRFVRLDSDRSRTGGGSGLGLAIVAEIVAAHGGSVSAGERPGGGTVVTVQLPAPDESSR